MTANVTNQVAYLRTSREFPESLPQLTVELNKAYIDIAQAVNSRTISTFNINRATINGENWFITGNQRQQALRQVYGFNTTTAINHGLNLNRIDRFTRCFGQYTDGTNWYGLINASPTAISGQVSFYITPTQIVFVVDGAAPSVTKGQVVLEWLSVT